MFTRYAYAESHILDIKGAPFKVRTASLDTVGDFDNYRTDDGYMYVRIRAISSRVNKNNDGWPTVELAGSHDVLNHHKQASEGFTVEAKKGNKARGFATFVGKPIFVDHNNTDPRKGRGVIVDSKFRVLDQHTAATDEYWKTADVDPEHLPASEVELLLEVDSKQYPKFAKAIKDGELDGFSMGANVEYTKCSHCGNEAHDPTEFCSHVLMKGAEHEFKDSKTGKRVSKRSYENCYGCGFFEISGVFDPADETALTREVRAGIEKEAELTREDILNPPAPDPVQEQADYLVNTYGYDPNTAKEHAQRLTQASFKDPFRHVAENPLPQSMMTKAPDEVDTLREEQICPVCFTPETLVRTDKGTIPISSVKVGDRVLTSSKAFMPVEHVMTRQYDGEMIGVDTGASSEVIWATPNHPFKVLAKNHGGECRPGWCDKRHSVADRHRLVWSCAEHLTDQTHLVVNEPRINSEGSIDFITIPTKHREASVHQGQKRHGSVTIPIDSDALWAFGLYIAEGSAGKREISFALHHNEVEYQNRIRSTFERLGYNTTLRTRDPNNAWVIVYSSTLASWFPEWFGSHSDQKRIPAELLNLPDHQVQHILTGILNGDGCDSTDKLRQTSSVLASQVVEISHRLRPERRASICHEYAEGKKPIYIVSNASGVGMQRTSESQRDMRFGHGKWAIGDRALHRVRSIERKQYTGTVYNLAVSGDDPTYTVNNILVHNCGNDMDSEQCSVCGYVAPPKEFDNPDLTKAQDVRDEMKQMDDQESEQTPPSTAPDPNAPPGAGSPPPPTAPGATPGAGKPPVAASVTDAMARNWTPKVNARVAARINQVERPIRSSGQTTNEPQNEVVLSDQTRPVTSAMRTAQQLIAAVKNQSGETMSTRTADGPTPPDASPDARVDVNGVGGVMDASNEQASKADAQVNVDGVGGTGVEGVEADSTQSVGDTAGQSSDDSGFNTDKTTEDSGPTSTYGDSDGSASGVGDPVTSETPYWVDESKWSRVNISADGNDKTLEQQEQQGDPAAQGGSAVKGVQPVAEQFGERVNVLEHKTTPANNSGETSTWNGTDGNGVLKQQEPVTHEEQEWGGVKVPDVQLHTTGSAHHINCDRLVDLEEGLGLIGHDERWNRMASLHQQDSATVLTRIEALAQVKTAGTKMAAQHKLATRIPRGFGAATSANHDFERIAATEQKESSVVDSDLDAALFTR